MNLFLRAGIAISVLTLLIVGHTTTGIAETGDFLPTEKQCSSLENPDAKTKGWCVAINRRQGNCLACHIIVTDKWPTAFPPGGRENTRSFPRKTSTTLSNSFCRFSVPDFRINRDTRSLLVIPRGISK